MKLDMTDRRGLGGQMKVLPMPRILPNKEAATAEHVSIGYPVKLPGIARTLRLEYCVSGK